MESEAGYPADPSEGTIKFSCRWTEAMLSLESGVLEPLQRWRTTLLEAGLIGALPDGVGFGNLSVRSAGQGFLITGSGTGGLAEMDASHFSLVTEYHFEENVVHCRGQTRASSEALSHAALYATRPEVGAVIHVHSRALWEEHLNRLPTTDNSLAYGTPEMALALADLGSGLDDGEAHTLVMGGHTDGLITFGPDLETAGQAILRLVASSGN